MSKILGISLNNYFVINVTNITSLNPNGTITFQYIFKLNSIDYFNTSLLLYFKVDVYTNLTNDVVNSFDARFDKVFDVVLNTSDNVLYNFIADNEIQTLEGTITISTTNITDPNPDPRPNPTPNPNPCTTSTPSPILKQEDNETSDNIVANATIKETGILFIGVLLVIITNFYILSYGKKE